MKRTPCRRCAGTGYEAEWTTHGARMRKRRQRLGMSLRALGEAVGVSAMYVSDLENGKRAWRGPKARTVEAFIEAQEGK